MHDHIVAAGACALLCACLIGAMASVLPMAALAAAAAATLELARRGSATRSVSKYEMTSFLCHLSQTSEMRVALIDQDGVEVLMRLSTMSASDLRIDEMTEAHMLHYPDIRRTIRRLCSITLANIMKHGALLHPSTLHTLIDLAMPLNDSRDRIEWCSLALNRLSAFEASRKMMCSDPSAVPGLIGLLRSSSSTAQLSASAALCNLACYAQSRPQFQKVFRDLIVITLLRVNEEEVKEICAKALFNLLTDPRTRVGLMSEGFAYAFVKLGRLESVEIQKLCVLTLYNFSCDNAGRDEIKEKRNGAIQVLVRKAKEACSLEAARLAAGALANLAQPGSLDDDDGRRWCPDCEHRRPCRPGARARRTWTAAATQGAIDAAKGGESKDGEETKDGDSSVVAPATGGAVARARRGRGDGQDCRGAGAHVRGGVRVGGALALSQRDVGTSQRVCCTLVQLSWNPMCGALLVEHGATAMLCDMLNSGVPFARSLCATALCNLSQFTPPVASLEAGSATPSKRTSASPAASPATAAGRGAQAASHHRRPRSRMVNDGGAGDCHSARGRLSGAAARWRRRPTPWSTMADRGRFRRGWRLAHLSGVDLQPATASTASRPRCSRSISTPPWRWYARCTTSRSARTRRLRRLCDRCDSQPGAAAARRLDPPAPRTPTTRTSCHPRRRRLTLSRCARPCSCSPAASPKSSASSRWTTPPRAWCGGAVAERGRGDAPVAGERRHDHARPWAEQRRAARAAASSHAAAAACGGGGISVGARRCAAAAPAPRASWRHGYGARRSHCASAI